jgi:protein-S-isoprenylcysteine O-methyltransferase Ste14
LRTALAGSAGHRLVRHCKMGQKMTHFGVGPKIMAPAIAYDIVAVIATHFWPDVFLMRSIPFSILTSTGIVLLIFGVPMWVIAVLTIVRAFRRGELVTSGVYGLVRHPVYSAWIVFIFPGIALLCRSWPMLLASLVAYIVFKLLIKREERYLEEKFGQAYFDYRQRVNEIIPIPRFWRNY